MEDRWQRTRNHAHHHDLNPRGGSDPGGDFGGPLDLVWSSGRLYFPADDGTYGRELWALDLGQRILLRNDSALALAPLRPALATVFPLRADRDRYMPGVSPGTVDRGVSVKDASTPLVFFGLDGLETLKLAKTGGGIVVGF